MTIAIGEGLLAEAGARITPLLASGRSPPSSPTRNVASASPRARSSNRLAAAGIASSADRPAGRARRPRAISHLAETVRRPARRRHRAPRHDHRAGRRRHRRSRRLCRGDPAARRRLHPDSDDAAGAGRFLGRRQDRHQFAARQESDRRLPPAARGARRYRPPRHAAAAASSPRAMPRSPNTACSAMPQFFAWLEANAPSIFAGDRAVAHPCHHQ